jgi:DNA-directed RNA polymerase specialized sigma24 family protein
MSPVDIEATYRRFASLVHARARRLVGNDADDICHEVFLRFLRKPPRGDRFASWFFVTTTHLCLDRLRHAARRDESWRTQATAALAGDELAGGPWEASLRLSPDLRW